MSHGPAAAMKVMGVDPGMEHTGLALVTGTTGRVDSYRFGTVTTSTAQTPAQRLLHIHREILAAAGAERPDLLVVEDVFSVPRFPQSSILLGKVTGAILVACCQSGVPVVEVAVKEAKKVLTGNGRASKAQLERAVRQILGRTEPVCPTHAADACALAIIGLYRHGHRTGRPLQNLEFP